MRHERLLLTLAVLLVSMGLACARITLDVKSVGFSGFYRSRTVVPILVQVTNTGDTASGEFRVLAPSSAGALPDHYRMRVTIPKGARQTYTLYVVPRAFTRELTVRFTPAGAGPVSASFRRCEELYDTARLLVVVGGTGSSLSYVNGQVITVPEYAIPRPWDTSATPDFSGGYGHHPHPRGGTTSGKVNLVYLDGSLLPANPEAYGSVDMLALMSDVTENTLKAEAQAAIPVWAANGGHLLIAGSAVRSRLDAPFFRQFTAGPSTTLTNADGGTAQMRPFGAGYVTVLAYDPDTARSRDWRRISQFYGKLIANQGAGGAAVHALRDALSAAVMVRNLKPPNLQLIVIFLLIYLVILVPVNYFVLKKMDKRELAWVTTPVIVLVFTVGAYGIGYVTKGNRLVTNVVSVVETASGQQSGMAVSQLLIFSPSRTAYRLNLGGAALVARESGRDEYDDFGRPSRTGALTLLDTPAGLQVERLQVNMWAFRQMTMAHQIELGHGVTGALNDTGSSTPHVTGTVTNGTPFNFALCELYAGGRWVASFSLKPGQRLAVSPGGATPTVKLDEQEQFMLDSLRDKAKTGLFTTPHLREGFVLVGYTADPKARVPLTINDRAATGAMTMVVAHL